MRLQLSKQILLAGTLLVLLTGPASAEIISKVAAVINDTIITTYQLDQKVVEISAQDPAAASQKNFRRQVLDTMIEDELLLQRAQELELGVSDDEVNAAIDDVQQQNKLTRLQLIAALEQQGMSFETYRSNMKNQILRYRLIGTEVQRKIDVTGQEIRHYYEEHLDDYRNPPYVHLSNLMFGLQKETPAGVVEAVRAEAEQAHKRLLMGDSIADLLVTYSEASGGDMGKLKESDLAKAFRMAIADLQTGEISPIVEANGSLFIFKMEERSDGSPKPLETVRADIEKILLEKNREAAFKEWQKDLRANAYIDIRE